MQWWNRVMDWVSSDEGWRIVSGAVVPFVAIVVAGVVAALIGRAALRRVVRLHDDEARSAAVAGIVSAARKASVWSSLGAEERTYVDHLAHESSVRLRLLPIAGSGLAANWAEHELADIKRDSVSFSFQAEQSLADFRDRLIDWQHRPSKAKKLFKTDLERWKHEEAETASTPNERPRDWTAPTEPATPRAVPERPAPAPAPMSHDAFRPAEPAPAGRLAEPAPASPAAPGVAPSTTVEDRPTDQGETRALPATSARPSADDGSDDAQPYGQPVSAHQVRRRTSPDARDD
jgi:hypothetical protein